MMSLVNGWIGRGPTMRAMGAAVLRRPPIHHNLSGRTGADEHDDDVGKRDKQCGPSRVEAVLDRRASHRPDPMIGPTSTGR